MIRKKKAVETAVKAPVVDAQTEARIADVIASDGLPDDLRAAIKACPFHIASPIIRRGIDVGALVKMISAVVTESDADEVNRVINTQINRKYRG